MSASQVQVQPSKPKTRKDPRPRHATGAAVAHDGTPMWARVVNADPRMVYAMPCCIGTDSNSLPYYEAMGYVPVLYAGKDGPRLMAGNTSHNVGDVIEFNGHRLMQITRERHEEIQQCGVDGITGQQLADQWERKIRKNASADNPFAQFDPGHGRSGSPYVRRDATYNPDAEFEGDDDNG